MSKGGKQTQTTKTDVPNWVTTATRAQSDNIANLAAADPKTFVADWNPYQQGAADLASQLGGANPYVDQAVSMINLVGNYKAPRVQAQSLLDNLSAYQSPYTQSVVDAALADYDFGAGQSRAAQAADLARSSAFGGSRVGIAQAQTEGALARGRASTSASLYDQAFNTAAGLSAQDATRRQEASAANAQLAMEKQNQGMQLASLLSNIGFQQNESNRANVASMLNVGNALYGVQNAQAQAPLTTAGSLASAYGQLPSELFATKTTTTKGGGSGLGGALSSLGTFASGLGALGFAPFTGGASLGALGALGSVASTAFGAGTGVQHA